MRKLSLCECGGRPKLIHCYHVECVDFGQLVGVMCPKCHMTSPIIVDREDSDVQEVVDAWNNGRRSKTSEESIKKFVIKSTTVLSIN